MFLSQENQTKLIRDVLEELGVLHSSATITKGNAKHILTDIGVKLSSARSYEEGTAIAAREAKTNVIAKGQANSYWKLRVVILENVYNSLRSQFEAEGWVEPYGHVSLTS